METRGGGGEKALMDGWMDEWMDRWVDGWIDGFFGTKVACRSYNGGSNSRFLYLKTT